MYLRLWAPLMAARAKSNVTLSIDIVDNTIRPLNIHLYIEPAESRSGRDVANICVQSRTKTLAALVWDKQRFYY